MSQDLFAAFSAPQAQSEARSTSQSNTANYQKPAAATQHSSDLSFNQNYATSNTVPIDDFDDDDFGDFEDASVSRKVGNETKSAITTPTPNKNASQFPPKSTIVKPVQPADARIGKHPFAANMDILFSADDDDYDAGSDDMEDLSKNPEAAMAFSKRIINEQMNRPISIEQSTASRELPVSLTSPRPAGRESLSKRPKDPNVLFDAEDVSEESDEDDDFGDFENATASNNSPSVPASTQQIVNQSHMPSIDLLGLDDPIQKGVQVQSEGRNINHASASAVPTRSRLNRLHESTPPTTGLANEDDAWDDFEAAEPTGRASSFQAGPTITAVESKLPPKAQVNGQMDMTPPTNVPPPVILLSVFPSIFTSGRETLLDPLAKLDPAERQLLLGHPATHQFLQGYLRNAIVLGHIIAGRKSRWKRDQHLAQSMRIGPAAAGGKGGMKLAGVDKSEVAKEDREVLDAVRLWKAQVGKLRGAVTAASSSNTNGVAKFPPVPDIADQMPVRALKATEGGFVAPHACALCGLKREERVAKVDIDIDDSFGEWWLDTTSMHLVCRDFWVEHKSKLRSR